MQQAVEQLQQVALVGGAAAALGLLVDAVREQREPEGVASAVQQLYEHGRGIDGESELVGVVDVAMAFYGEQHRRTMVYQQLAAQVGLLLELLHIQPVGAAVEVPVDVARALAGVVLPVVGEFGREAMKRTFMPAGDEAFHHMAGIKVERLVARDVGLVH